FYALNLQNQQFMIQQAQSLGELFQGLDQAAIDRTFAEFLRTRPEYSPLLNFLHALSVTFPPALATQTGLGSVGAAIGNVGTIAQTGMSIADLIKSLGGKPGGCWILTALYGKDAPITKFLWDWMTHPDYGWENRTFMGRFFVGLYWKYGERIAKQVKKHRTIRWAFKFLFDRLLSYAAPFGLYRGKSFREVTNA
ncbi:MAG: hypothetical protein Q8P03_00890, partial [bacterium]|nr:hypothetical protein [bacterium]